MRKNKTRNKISTPGYFIKRLKDNDITVFKVFKNYREDDHRKWTVLVDPGHLSIFITCYTNKETGEVKFEFQDGNVRFKNFYLITSSIEVIVTKLLNVGVKQRED